MPHQVKSIIDIFINTLLLAVLNQIPVRVMKRLLWLIQTNPILSDRWEYTIRQLHYYEPLPNFAAITQEQVLRKRSISSINWNWNAQLQLVEQLSVYSAEIQQLTKPQPNNIQFNFKNDCYRELDAAIYYAILRHLKPQRVIEIGSGYSTQIASLAIAANRQEGKPGKLISIEPYPQPQLMNVSLEIELISEKVEAIELSFFEQLESGDILFIDSTHTVKFGSDVCREFLDILPTLKSGVWIHIHDIFFPYDYPPKWLIEERRAWNEQYLVEAFLAYNSQFEVVLANHWLVVDYPQLVAKLWPGVLEWNELHRCGSLWLQKR